MGYQPKPSLHGLSLSKSIIKKPRNIIQVGLGRQTESNNTRLYKARHWKQLKIFKIHLIDWKNKMHNMIWSLLVMIEKKCPHMAKDWDNIHVFVKFLKIFFDITLKVLISNVHSHELCLTYNFIQKYLK